MQQSRDIEEEKSREKKVCKYLPGGTVRPTQAHILLQRGLERPRPTLLPMEPPLLRHDARWGLTFLGNGTPGPLSKAWHRPGAKSLQKPHYRICGAAPRWHSRATL